MNATLDQSVNQIVAGLRSLAEVMRAPESVHLASTHIAMERLHAALPLLSVADTAFAFVCERDPANGDPPRHTSTYQYRNSPGQRVAQQARSRHGGEHNRPPDPALFDPDG